MLCLVIQIVDHIQPILVFTLNLYVLHKHEALNICGFESCWPVKIAVCSLLRAGYFWLFFWVCIYRDQSRRRVRQVIWILLGGGRIWRKMKKGVQKKWKTHKGLIIQIGQPHHSHFMCNYSASETVYRVT